MSAYQFVNPAPLFFNIPGTDPLGTGGNLYFFDEGTTNPRDTWSDPALDGPSLNPNPVPLDASGRSTVAIWLDGDYTVELRDSLGDLVWSRPVRSDVIAGLSIPTLVADYILSNDGSNLAWVDPIGALFPDPSGSNGYVLSTDGANIFWIPLPTVTIPDPDIVVTTGSVVMGVSDDTNKAALLFGADSAPSSGSKTTSKSVTFGTAFSAAPKVFIQPTGPGSSSGVFVRVNSTSVSASGFTASFSTLTGGTSADSFSPSTINQAVPFDWFAIGNRTVP